MKTVPQSKSIATLIFLLIFLALLFGNFFLRYSYRETAVPEPLRLSPRLQEIFAKTKLACFGRYALQVPQEARVVWRSVWFPSDINIISGGKDAIKTRVANDIAKLKWKDDTAEITYNNEGPIDGSWQIRYYEGETEKKYGLQFFNTYVNKENLTFILGGAIEDG